MTPKLSLIQTFAVWVIPVLFAITVHEVAHGFVASKCGDRTAQMLGRLTLNPIKHIDIFGTVIIPALLLIVGGFIFGWAKPVPVNFANLKHPRRDMALVAIAGPVSNLLMAILWAMVAKIGLILDGQLGFTWALALIYMGQAGIWINIILIILNILPIPPLDGSRVVTALLPGPLAYQYNRVAPFGFFILLILLALGALNYLLLPPAILLNKFFYHLIGLM